MMAWELWLAPDILSDNPLYHFTLRLIQILAGEAGEARKVICIKNFVKWYYILLKGEASVSGQA
nr:hypothetical protein [Nostoc sp. DedQUE02]